MSNKYLNISSKTKSQTHRKMSRVLIRHELVFIQKALKEAKADDSKERIFGPQPQ